MFRTQKRDYRLDLRILKKLSDNFTNAIICSILAYHRQIAAKLNDPKTAPKT